MSEEYEEQLKAWVAGKPYHREECCVPDFSCCEPVLLAEKRLREKFYKEHKAGRCTMAFFMMFMEAGIKRLTKTKQITKKVHVAGFEYE